MESIHWRYYNSIRSYKFISVFFVLFISKLAFGQDNVDHKTSISNFLTKELTSLLQKSKDYNSINNKEENLRSALTAELKTLTLSINANAVIEYDQADLNGNEVIISDEILPFLINYSGRTGSVPIISIDCILTKDTDYDVFFTSSGVLAKDNILSKSIFRVHNESLELRRISFANELPNGCINNEKPLPNSSEATSSSTNNKSNQATVTRQKIPRITIREASNINGQAFIYGFIENYEKNGFLIDLETNSPINVSSRDGFFVINKFLTPSGYRKIDLKYQYGTKFITDRKLIFVK